MSTREQFLNKRSPRLSVLSLIHVPPTKFLRGTRALIQGNTVYTDLVRTLNSVNSCKVYVEFFSSCCDEHGDIVKKVLLLNSLFFKKCFKISVIKFVRYLCDKSRLWFQTIDTQMSSFQKSFLIYLHQHGSSTFIYLSGGLPFCQSLSLLFLLFC